MNNMRQCKLRKENSFMTAWIPERAAKVGNVTELKIKRLKEPGWKVMLVGGSMAKSSFQANVQM